MRILYAMGDDMGGGGSTDASDPAENTGSDQDQGSDDQTFFLPPDFPGADQYKPGDTITLRVVGQDKDGDLQVECVEPKGGDAEDWKSDLRQNVPETTS